MIRPGNGPVLLGRLFMSYGEILTTEELETASPEPEEPVFEGLEPEAEPEEALGTPGPADLAVQAAPRRKMSFWGKLVILLILLAAWLAFAYGVWEYLSDTLTVNDGKAAELYVGETLKLPITSEKGRESKYLYHLVSDDPGTLKVKDDGTLEALRSGVTKVMVQTNRKNVTGSCIVVTRYKKVKIKNGKWLVKPKGELIAPLSIKAEKGSDYYLYFRSIEPGNDFAIYVKSGKTLELKAPLGEYVLYYSGGGTEWYGKDYKFGNDTWEAKMGEHLRFYQEDYRIHGARLTLKIPEGNGPPDGEFPL